MLNGRVLESSLGYYINPLVNVLLGVMILGEKLETPVKAATGLAALGVISMAVSLGHLPWISVTLAFSFGLYGLARKLAPVGALSGLLIETLLLLPSLSASWSRVRRRARAPSCTRAPRLMHCCCSRGPLRPCPCCASPRRRDACRSRPSGFFSTSLRRFSSSSRCLSTESPSTPPAWVLSF